MNARTVIAKALTNDELLNQLSENWKASTSCKVNPVVDAIESHKALKKCVLLGLISLIAFGLVIVFFTHYTSWYIFLLLPIIVLCAKHSLITYLDARLYRHNAKRFLKALSIVESFLDNRNDGPDTTFWGMCGQSTTERLKIGGYILKPLTNRIKAIEKFAWHQKKVKSLRAEFFQTHSSLANIGFAERDHTIYWQ